MGTYDPRIARVIATAALMVGLGLLLHRESGHAQQWVGHVVLEIGEGIESELEGVWFSRVLDIRSTPDGRIYVADSGRREILIFSPSGGLITAVGGEGEGPGRFTMLGAMRVDSVIWVWDPMRRTETRFSLDGALLGSRSVTEPWLFGPGTSRSLRHGHRISETAPTFHPFQSRFDSPFYRLVVSGVGVRPDTVAEIRSRQALWFDADDMLPFANTATPFGQGGGWAFLGDSALVVADGYSGEVVWYRATTTGLQVLRRAHAPVNVLAVTESDLARFEQSLHQELRNELGARAPRAISVRAPSHWSGITRIVADETGPAVYLESAAGRTASRWRVLRNDGTIGPVTFPPQFELLSARGDTFYGIVRDGLGVVKVNVLQARSGMN